MYVIKPFKLRLVVMALFGFWQGTPATLIPVVLVAFYNGKRGMDMKWFFYAAYPVHLGILYYINTHM
jgi:hypothetical protein